MIRTAIPSAALRCKFVSAVLLELFIVFILSGGAGAQGWQETTLQNNGSYAGVADTYIETASWAAPPQFSRNNGTNPSLLVDRSGGSSLIRFDVSSFPANTSVQSAKLRLYNKDTTAQTRRIKLYSVLRSWDEGNQNNDAMNASGDRGTTGDYAFSFYSGEGTNVAWAARGLQPGTDYAASEIGYIDVLGSGWYEAEISPQVQQWIRTPGQNRGLILKDSTGYIAGNPDYRTFHSSQSSSQTLRPALVVVYNPDTPLADAGDDIEQVNWSGAGFALDGTGSTQGAGISYSWSVAARPPGSQAGPESFAPNDSSAALSPAFTPDRPGDYTLRLTVTNGQGHSAADDVAVRLWAIPAGHPRLHLNAQRLQALRVKRNANAADWVRLKGYADGSGANSLIDQALVYQVTGEAVYGSRGVAALMNYIATNTNVITSGSGGSHASTVALGYDWLHALLTAEQKNQIIAYLKTQVEGQWNTGMTGWNNYGGAMPWRIGFAGLATYGENAEAKAWIDHARYTRFHNLILAGLVINGDGGGWVEGSGYEFTATSIFRYADGVWTATGERLFDAHPWFRDYLTYALFSDYPAVRGSYSGDFRDTVQIGDMEHNRPSFYTYRRLIAEMGAKFYAGTPDAQHVQWYLQQPPGRAAATAFAWEDFLHWNTAETAAAPAALAHFAPGLGRVFMRSSFDLPGSTHIGFFAGDHFTYHQDIAQGSFTIFKHDDLAVRSGVYDGYGDTSPSSHLLAYNSRTIAGNTILICQNGEVYNHYRAGTTVGSDCGQTPAIWTFGNSPTIEQWQSSSGYDSANITAYHNDSEVTYAAADLTGGYNSSKAARVLRRLAYLRPAAGEEFLLVFDVVEAVNPNFTKKVLLHFLNEPAVEGTRTVVHLGEEVFDGSLVRADAGQGRLYMRTLLPRGARIRKIGGRIKGTATNVSTNSITDGSASFQPGSLAGNTLSFTNNYNLFNRQYPITANTGTTITVDTSGYPDLIALGVVAGREYSAGRDYWVNGKNYPATTTDYEADYGAYRVEIEPGSASATDLFLQVLYPTGTATAAMPETVLLETAAMSGVLIRSSVPRVALFSRDGEPKSGAAYSVQYSGTAKHFITGLLPGAYELRRNGAPLGPNVTAANGALSFAAADGAFELVQVGASAPAAPGNLRKR